MDQKILEDKMELLRWVINLNDEQVIKNLINFKNEIFGVPFSDTPTRMVSPTRQNVRFGNELILTEDYLKFEEASNQFLEEFGEALSLEEAKEQSIKKIQGWWRD